MDMKAGSLHLDGIDNLPAMWYTINNLKEIERLIIMQKRGIIRLFDSYGRITIPRELRRKASIPNEAPAIIKMFENKIIIEKYDPAIYYGNEEG